MGQGDIGYMINFKVEEFKNITTFKVGGKIKYFCKVKDTSDVRECVSFAKSNNLPIFVVGWGSDILVSDLDYNGVVISFEDGKITYKDIPGSSLVEVTADAGISWDKLVSEVVSKGLGGIELLSGIPGTVGASPVQNIGAFGQELKDVVSSVTVYDSELEKEVVLTNQDCAFSYRESIFKRNINAKKYIILKVTFSLSKNYTPKLDYQTLKDYLQTNKIHNPSLQEVRDAILAIRNQRIEDPAANPNAGSYFKNPAVSREESERLKSKFKDIQIFENPDGSFKIPAAWLIENVGWKGKSLGRAKVSSKHALILVNPKGEASAEEIKALGDNIIKDVYNKFGIKLEPEVQFVNF